MLRRLYLPPRPAFYTWLYFRILAYCLYLNGMSTRVHAWPPPPPPHAQRPILLCITVVVIQVISVTINWLHHCTVCIGTSKAVSYLKKKLFWADSPISILAGWPVIGWKSVLNAGRCWSRFFHAQQSISQECGEKVKKTFQDRFASVGEQNNDLKAPEVFMVALKWPKATKGGKMQHVTRERSTVAVTTTLLGITKRSRGRIALHPLSPVCFPWVGWVKKKKRRVYFVGRWPRQTRSKAVRSVITNAYDLTTTSSLNTHAFPSNQASPIDPILLKQQWSSRKIKPLFFQNPRRWSRVFVVCCC